MVLKVLWITLAAAFAVFCIVQDRVTAEGARRYVALQKAALAGRGSNVTIDEVMQPAIARSVRLGLASSAAVAVAGVGIGFVVRRRWPDA
jgi:hypothetical protein